MKNLYRLAFVALAALLAPAALAQQQGRVEETLVALYDLDSASYTYCSSAGVGGAVLSDGIPVAIPVTTSGSSTTVSAITATTAPFAQVAIGDIIYFLQTQVQATPEPLVKGRVVERVVTAKASSDSITISSAIQLPATPTGTTFYRRPVTCGTAATNGWVPLFGYREASFTFMLNQGTFTTGGVDARWECRNSGVDAQPVAIYTPATFTTPGITSRYTVVANGTFDECRIGFKLSGTDDGPDTAGTEEQITTQFRAIKW